MNITRIGIDIGKKSFHVIGQDQQGHQILRKKFSRSRLLQFLMQLPQCQIAMEACAGSHWLARQCQSMGHDTRLLSAYHVKPYITKNKNDFNDAAGICEASSRPTMTSIPIKSIDDQALDTQHCLRERWIKQRTACMNQIHGLLLEQGIATSKGHSSIRQTLILLDTAKEHLSPLFIQAIEHIYKEYQWTDQQIKALDKELAVYNKQHALGQLLLTIPGIGLVNASALISHTGGFARFKRGRDFAAWMGLVPRQHSTGGQSRLLGISKRGNKYLRTLLIHGARSVLKQAHRMNTTLGQWLRKLSSQKPYNVVATALTNKLARIVWAVITTKTPYQSVPLMTV